MSFIQILLISLGLAMDSFTVSICKGLEMKKIDYKYSITLGIFFGSFQAIMAFLGWLIGTKFDFFQEVIENFIAFILLVAIGGKMICESFEKKDVSQNVKYDYKEIITLSIATSIDALAVGIMMAMMETSIIESSLIIGVVAGVLSFIGVIIGDLYGAKHAEKAEILGGTILIILGIKFLFA